MWLATLNPGRTARRGRRKRRTLSAWQRMVKKAGGVMQAVKLRRKLKKGRRRKSLTAHAKRRGFRRRYRRNSFLTTTLSSGGAHVLMNAGKRRRRKIRSRRSAVSGRSRSGRSRRAAARRSKMARKTRRRHRRTPPRGRGGRFKSRSHRRRHRRVRRNPVLPISWNPSRRRRRRRSRRNPLFLSRRGFSNRKHKGYRRLHRRRHSPRFWHNPRRRRHSRRYRHNSVLPISWNPGGMLSGGPVGSVMGRVKSFVDVRFWTETGVPAAVGFFGSKAAGNFIYNNIPNAMLTAVPAAQPYIRMASDAIGGAGLAWLVGRFVGKKQGDALWLGTVVNVAYSLLKNLLGGTGIASTIGLDGLGDDLADRMRGEIARRVQASIRGGHLNGVGSYLRETNLSEYVTEGALRRSDAYSPGNALGDEALEGGGY